MTEKIHKLKMLQHFVIYMPYIYVYLYIYIYEHVIYVLHKIILKNKLRVAYLGAFGSESHKITIKSSARV